MTSPPLPKQKHHEVQLAPGSEKPEGKPLPALSLLLLEQVWDLLLSSQVGPSEEQGNRR